VVRQTSGARGARRPLRPRLVALVEHGQQAGVFDSHIPALAVNELINGLMYALVEAVTAGDVQPEQAPEMFGVAALGLVGLPRGRAWQLVRRAASQADTQG
jgi:hypothetical protein